MQGKYYKEQSLLQVQLMINLAVCQAVAKHGAGRREAIIKLQHAKTIKHNNSCHCIGMCEKNQYHATMHYCLDNVLYKIIKY